MAVRNLATVQWLQGSPTAVESRPGRIGPISLGGKQTGERSAGNLHAAFDEAGAGNVAWSRWCDTRRTKGRDNGEHKLRPSPARQSSTLTDERGWETGRWPKAQATAPILDFTHVGHRLTMFRRAIRRHEQSFSALCNGAQAPTPEMAVTPPSIRKSAPTTHAELSDAR